MRPIYLAGLLAVYWKGFYALSSMVHDEKLVVGAFVACIVVSMVSAVILLVDPHK